MKTKKVRTSATKANSNKNKKNTAKNPTLTPEQMMKLFPELIKNTNTGLK